MQPGPGILRSGAALRMLVAVWIVWAAGGESGFAQAIKNGPVKLLLTPLATRARSQSLVPVTVSLKSEDPELLRGDLEFKIVVSDRLVHRLVIPDLALTMGETRLRMVLPEVRVDQLELAVRARVEFRTGNRILDLGEHDIVIPVESRRNSTIISVQNKERVIGRPQLDLIDSLLLHRFSPEEKTNQRIGLVTNPSSVSPEEMPTSPATLCGVDLILLYREGLLDLRREQLRAILEWVRAGGSVCVVPPPRGMDREQVEFLRELAGGEPGDNTPGDQSPEPGGAAAAGVRILHPGLGVAAIVEEPARFEPWLDSTDWTNVVCRLWRIRPEQAAQILASVGPGSSGVWSRPGGTNALIDIYRPSDDPEPYLDLGLDMRPERAKRIPYWTFLGILVAFLLLAAPGDYYLLGWLKLRRLTWWFLPLISLAFTWLTATIADRTLGASDYRAAYDVVDIGSQGVPVRTSRFESIFVASPQTRELDLKQTFYVDLTRSNDELARHVAEDLRQQGAFSEAEAAARQRANEIPLIVGRPPFDYQISQALRQWAPVVSRQTSLGGRGGGESLPWQEYLRIDWRTAEGLQQVVDRIRAVEPEAQVLRLHQGRVDEQSPRPLSDPLRRFLVSVSTATPESQYFAVVTQVSPSGHSNLEDLKLLNPQDGREALLIVVLPKGADKTIYRLRGRWAP